MGGVGFTLYEVVSKWHYMQTYLHMMLYWLI